MLGFPTGVAETLLGLDVRGVTVPPLPSETLPLFVVFLEGLALE